MPDIFHNFEVRCNLSVIFELVSTPAGLEKWWTLRSSGTPGAGEEYGLFFGKGYDWRAVVTQFDTSGLFELQMTSADPDWLNTRITFFFKSSHDAIQVQFRHSGWPECNEHFKISSYCWAMYLRLLKRYTERGEFISYHERLEE